MPSFPNTGPVCWLFWIHQPGYKAIEDFTLVRPKTLVGKLSHLVKGAYQVHHLVSHMYTSIAHALAKNTEFLKDVSEEFKKIVRTIRAKNYTCSGTRSIQGQTIQFAMKQAVKKVHQCKREFFTSTTCVWRLNSSASFYAPTQAFNGRRH